MNKKMSPTITTLLTEQRNEVELEIKKVRRRLKLLEHQLLLHLDSHYVELKEVKIERNNPKLLHQNDNNSDRPEYRWELQKINAEGTDFSDPSANVKTKNTSQITAVLNTINSEINDIEKEIQKVSDGDIKLRDSNKPERCSVSFKTQNEPNASLIRLDETETRKIISKAKENLMRLKEKISYLENSLILAQADCSKEDDKDYQQLLQLHSRYAQSAHNINKVKEELQTIKPGLTMLKTIMNQGTSQNSTEEGSLIGQKEIKKYKDKIKVLRDDCTDFQKTIVQIRRSNQKIYEKLVDKQKANLRRVNTEYLVASENIRLLESEIAKAREGNDLLRENLKKKLECAHNQSNNGCDIGRDIGRYRMEEQEAKITVEKLQDHAKKLSKQLILLKNNLFKVHEECRKEEKRVNTISEDFENLKNIKKKGRLSSALMRDPQNRYNIASQLGQF